MSNVPPSAHGRTPPPLTETETRAALRAVGRILELARDEVGRFARADKLSDVLASAGSLPEMLTRPAVFRERFRPTLEGLARRHEEFAPVLSEYDRWTNPPPRPRRRKALYDELWIDCGAGD
jgi:broad specificity phosphatase PhoE